MMRKRGTRHWHTALDILDAETLRPCPDQQSENLQPARLSQRAELVDKITRHDISSITEILNAQVQPPRHDDYRIPQDLQSLESDRPAHFISADEVRGRDASHGTPRPFGLEYEGRAMKTVSKKTQRPMTPAR